MATLPSSLQDTATKVGNISVLKSNVSDKINNAVTSKVNNIANQVNNTVNSVTTAVNGKINTVTSAVNDVTNRVNGVVSQMGNVASLAKNATDLRSLNKVATGVAGLGAVVSGNSSSTSPKPPSNRPSMTVESSVLFPDISEILKDYGKDCFRGNFEVTVKLHTELKDLDVRDGISVNKISVLRDYVVNMGDFIEIELNIPLGNLVYDVYDYLENIEVTLTTIKQLHKSKTPFYHTERYKAVFLADKNNTIPSVCNITRADLNQQMHYVLTLQLLDRSAEVMRVKTTQGNFDNLLNKKNTDMSPKAFMKSLMSEEFDKILIENKPALDTIDIEDPDNKEGLGSVTLPSGTRVIEIPEYLQVKNVGVYSAGIGAYVQRFGTDHFTYKKSLFIYSVYDGNKYQKADYKVIFFVPVVSSHSTSNYTYKYKDKILKCLPNNVSKIDDIKESSAMSTGVGYRTSNAKIYMTKPVEMKPEGPVFKRNEFNSEVVLKDRSDGLNFAPNKSVTSNQFHLSSDLVSKMGKYIVIEMNNFEADFIHPGQACKINYETKNGKITELYGVIHRVAIVYSSPSINMAMNAKNNYVSLTNKVVFHIFVSNL